MTKEELISRVNEIAKSSIATSEKDLENLKININVDGETYSVYLAGTDEMIEMGEFFQIGIDARTGKEYRFYYSTTDEDGNPIELDDIDYENACRMEPVEEE